MEYIYQPLLENVMNRAFETYAKLFKRIEGDVLDPLLNPVQS